MADRKSDAIVADDAEDHCKQYKNNPRRHEVAPTSHTPLDQSLYRTLIEVDPLTSPVASAGSAHRSEALESLIRAAAKANASRRFVTAESSAASSAA